MLKFKTFIFISVLAILAGCDDNQPVATQQAAQQETAPPYEPNIHDFVQKRVEGLMQEWGQECESKGIAGAQQCWLNKSQGMTYQYMQDISAYRNLKSQLEPRFVEYMEAYNAKGGAITDCYKAAGRVVRMQVFCGATQLVHLNMAIQQYQNGTWKYPPANEDFVGE